jgi:hypothetical protein
MNVENKCSPLKYIFALVILYSGYFHALIFKHMYVLWHCKSFVLLSWSGQHSSPWTICVCDCVSCCMTHGTSSHFPFYSFHVTESIYCVWENMYYFNISVYVLACEQSIVIFMAQQPLVDQCLLVIEAIRSHSDTPHLLGLLWMSDQPDAGTSTWQHTTFTRDRHPCPQWDSNMLS